MERLRRWSLAGGMVLALGMAGGCRGLHSEVPREPARTTGMLETEGGHAGFSQEPHAQQGTPFPNGAPGSSSGGALGYGGRPAYSQQPPGAGTSAGLDAGADSLRTPAPGAGSSEAPQMLAPPQ
jgi:hypothetical protein